MEALQHVKLTVTNSSIGLIYALKKFFDTNYNVQIYPSSDILFFIMKKVIIFGANSSISKNFVSDFNVKKKFQFLGITRHKTSKFKHFKKILEWDVLNEI